jgi:hypothetical protein
VKREEARLELDATTLRPQDASPEARTLLESDAELAAWHEKRTAFDEKAAAAYQAITAMPDLRDSILRAAKTPAKRSFRWLMPMAIAAAACAMLGWVLLWPGVSGQPGWESASLNAIAKVEYGMSRLDHKANTLSEVQQLLASQVDSPSPEVLPETLAKLRTYGCKSVLVNGRKASIICFELESGKEAHLIVMNQAGLDASPPQDAPSFKSAQRWHYASWSHGSQVYLLATTADADALKKLFGRV